jgi:hypothetical protein
VRLPFCTFFLFLIAQMEMNRTEKGSKDDFKGCQRDEIVLKVKVKSENTFNPKFFL